MGREATKWCEQRGERTFAWRAGSREREGWPCAGPGRGAGFGREASRELDQKDKTAPILLTPGRQSLVFQRKGSRHVKGEDRSKVTSRSTGLDTALSQPAEGRSPPEARPLGPARECGVKGKRPARHSSFSGLSSGDSVLRETDDGQFDQEDGVTQVTCM